MAVFWKKLGLTGDFFFTPLLTGLLCLEDEAVFFVEIDAPGIHRTIEARVLYEAFKDVVVLFRFSGGRVRRRCAKSNAEFRQK
jgi:hypothetical protein